MNAFQRLRQALAAKPCEPAANAEPTLIQQTEDEMVRTRLARKVLTDKLNATGFFPGDAALGRIDRRFLPSENKQDEGQ